jgi:hypothetical protein
MGLLQDLTEKLAQDVMKAIDETGDDRLHEKVAKVLLDTSPTTQEAFLTAMKALLAERKGREFLNRVLKAKRDGQAAPAAPYGSDAGH